MSNLFLAIDYSSTGPKFFYGENAADELLPMTIAPQVVEVAASTITSFVYENMPDYSIIRLGEQIHLTGQAASNYLSGAVYLKASKVDKAIPQTLSAIAYAAEALNLGNKITLDIKCLLPAGEIQNDRSRLELELIEAAKNFGTLRSKYRCRLRSFTCKPEGAGLLRKFSELREVPLKSLSVGVMSLGYRNAGFFSLVDRTPGHYRSPRLGFSVLINEFRSKLGGLDEVDVTEQVSKYLETGDQKHLEYITRFGKDIESIIAKAEDAKDVYCMRLKRDIEEHMPNVDEIVAGGGSVQVLRKHLHNLLGQDNLYVHAGLGKAWDYPEHLKAKLKDDMYYRFADLYCFC
jgi:hypothetical protein